MSQQQQSETIQVTEEELALPLATETGGVLTSRAFITGTSGSGKSNTVGVICEKLLDQNFPMLIVDTEGEYYGLKQEYKILHVGATEDCDIQVGIEHAERIATLALEQNVPIILDVSGYIDEEEANKIIEETLRHLFQKEQKLKKPFPVILEEAHNYIPQKGSKPEVADIILKIGKQGRKRGLGLIAVSQRPADVQKAFITQSDWRVWHNFEWGNDLDVAKDVLGKKSIATSEEADQVEDIVGEKVLEGDSIGFDEIIAEFEPGQAVLECGFIEKDRLLVEFKRKTTFDAGATPTLDDHDRPELEDIGEEVISELQEVSEKKRQRENKIEKLERRLEEKEEEIERLEEERDRAQDVSELGERLTEAIREGGGNEEVSEKIEEIREEKNSRIRELEEKLEESEERKGELQEQLDEYREQVQELEQFREYKEIAEEIEEKKPMIEEALERLAEGVGIELGAESSEEAKKQIEQKEEKIRKLETRIEDLQKKEGVEPENRFSDAEQFLSNETVREQVERASENTTYGEEHFWDILTVIAEEAGASVKEIVPLVEISKSSVQTCLGKMKEEKVIYSEKEGKTPYYHLNEEGISDIISLKEKRERIKNKSEKVKPQAE